ncbi:MAG: hypothetical protein RR627_06840, partial [Niameybacter sp.]
MKFEKNNKYFTVSVYVVGSILVTILSAFLLINFKLMGGYIAQFIGWLYGLLKPLIFGLVIAYLLDPLTTFFERWIKKLFKKKNIDRNYPTVLTLVSFLVIVGLFSLLIVLNVKKVIGGGAVKNLQDSLTQYAEYFANMIQSMDLATSHFPFMQGDSSLIMKIYEGI